MSEEELDEILGITRCVRCGHRLDGEIECPFCSLFPDRDRQQGLPKWVFLTACFLTSPISIYAIVRTNRLHWTEKILAGAGCLMWLGLWRLFR